jgi:hypothetical protein
VNFRSTHLAPSLFLTTTPPTFLTRTYLESSKPQHNKMAEFTSPPAFDNFDYQNHNLDSFLSFYSPCDIVVPTPGDFEFDIDSGLEGFDEQLQVLQPEQLCHPKGFHRPFVHHNNLGRIRVQRFRRPLQRRLFLLRTHQQHRTRESGYLC